MVPEKISLPRGEVELVYDPDLYAYVDVLKEKRLMDEYSRVGVYATPQIVRNHAVVSVSDVDGWLKNGLIGESEFNYIKDLLDRLAVLKNRVGVICERKRRASIS